MSASVTDKLRKGAAAFSTTLAADKGASAASATLSNSISIPTTTAVDFTIGRVDANGNKTPATKAVYKATLSGVTISNLVLVEGTDQLHKAGTPVEITLTAAMWNDMIDHNLAQHNQDGTHGAITSTNATLTTPKLITSINDTNGNELLKMTANASAINELTLSNATTGNAPSLAVTSSSDTNGDMRLIPLGTGNIKRGATGGSIDWWEELGRYTISSAGDVMTVNIPAKKYLKILYTIKSVNTTNVTITFNGDTSANYAYQYLLTNGTTVTGGSGISLAGLASILPQNAADTNNIFGVFDITNFSTMQKLISGNSQLVGTVATSSDAVLQIWGHWISNSQITSVTLTNPLTGDYGIGSELVVLGHD